jgi:hypothetical protein
VIVEVDAFFDRLDSAAITYRQILAVLHATIVVAVINVNTHGVAVRRELQLGRAHIEGVRASGLMAFSAIARVRLAGGRLVRARAVRGSLLGAKVLVRASFQIVTVHELGRVLIARRAVACVTTQFSNALGFFIVDLTPTLGVFLVAIANGSTVVNSIANTINFLVALITVTHVTVLVRCGLKVDGVDINTFAILAAFILSRI